MTRDDKGRFVKGVSGNPNGRKPKEQEIVYYDILVSEVTPKDFREIVRKAKEQAKRGDQAARKWLTDYLIGPPVQKQEVTGKDGEAIIVTLKHSDEKS